MDRLATKQILSDLEKKMVLLAGPRQTGKTTLAKSIAKNFKKVTYLNYDSLDDRKIIESESWLPNLELLILDEIHKMPKWKNFLKGIYDTKSSSLKILVTGSARLETYRQAGDSLAGRYYLHHLFPFTPAELDQLGHSPSLDRIIKTSGFPEPFLSNSDTNVNRWRLQYTDALIREDVLSIENVYNLKSMQLVFKLLRKRVGSSVSYQSISEDAQISPNTVKRYIEIFEALYLIFRVSPFSYKIARSLIKEPKLYFFDTGLVDGDIGAKLENTAAISLYSHALLKRDLLGLDCNLHYLRTKEKEEVDFALCTDNKVDFMVEIKAKDKTPSPAILKFQAKYGFKAIQAVYKLKNEQIQDKVEILGLESFLAELKTE